MEALITTLREGHHSLVVLNDGRIYTYDGRGVSDLWRIYNKEREVLSGATLADKIVGKGAAALMVVGGVKKVWAEVISLPAQSLLEDNHIEVQCETLVPNIINRSGDGICPVEQICAPAANAEECIPLIHSFLQRMKQA